MRYTLRGASVAAVGGALLLFGGTIVHPSGADPNDAIAAFSEYAADQLWIASHLTQLLGVALIVCALIQLSRLLASGSARGLAWISAAGAIASLAVAAATQAVDGIARIPSVFRHSDFLHGTFQIEWRKWWVTSANPAAWAAAGASAAVPPPA